MRRRPTSYGWVMLMVVATLIVGLAVGTVIVLHSREQAQRAQRQAAEESARTREATRLAVCAVVVAQEEALNDPDDPPRTMARKRAIAAWHDLRVRFRC